MNIAIARLMIVNVITTSGRSYSIEKQATVVVNRTLSCLPNCLNVVS